MRAVIISSGTYLDKRIERLLMNNDIKGDIVKKLTRDMINHYNAVVFTHKNDIPNLPKVIEMIVLEKKLQVIFINNTSAIGQFYNTVNSLYFNIVNEMTMDYELPILIKSHNKYIKEITYLEEQNDKLKESLELLKLTNKAKQILMNKGLTEAESHKCIQQKAMSMRVSKLKLVNLIIENKIDI